MRVNKTYSALLEKSINSMLSAIEIYNKPNFNYREETFAVLAINAWELLLKAYILRANKYKIRSIYSLEPTTKKDGTLSQNRKKPKLNRCGNPMSISIFECLRILDNMHVLSYNLKNNIESIIELRDNAIHFVNLVPISKQLQELGFACIKNYISAIKLWNISIDISQYNLYLMPLAYIDEKITVGSVVTEDNEKYVSFIKHLLESNRDDDQDFDIAISIDIDFKKGNSFDAIGVKYDANGTLVNLSEEQLHKKYPWTYKDVAAHCRERYRNFKQDSLFNTYMQEIKANSKLSNLRCLFINNPKTPKTYQYSTNVLQFFDERYIKKNSQSGAPTDNLMIQ